MALDPDCLTSRAMPSYFIGVLGMNLGVPPQHLVESVRIGLNRVLGHDEGVWRKVRHLFFPVMIQALNDTDDRDYRRDSNNYPEQSEKRPELVRSERVEG